MRKKLLYLLDDALSVYRLDAWENSDRIANHLIANGVTIPVRCKDCVNYCGFEHCKNGICDVDSVSKRAVCPNDFCSYGERKIE